MGGKEPRTAASQRTRDKVAGRKKGFGSFRSSVGPEGFGDGKGGRRHGCAMVVERWLLADAQLLGRETRTGEVEQRNMRKRGREQGNARAMK